MTLAETKATLFSAGPVRAFEMGADDVATLQKFYDANPEYHWIVGGQAPRDDQAQETFKALPPDGWPFERKWLLVFVDDDDSVAGVADVISNLFAEGVWHVGLFIVATSLHGSGAAKTLYSHLKSWMRSRGARWLRLGVVKRHGVEMGKRVNTLRMMVKPLVNESLADYLAMVARDRPESP